MVIRVGQEIPSVELFDKDPDHKINLKKYIAGKKVIIFGVPGAFTPGCSQTHVPSFLKRYVELKKEGIDDVICISVNDPYVMTAWAKDLHTEGKITMLADPLGVFTKAIGLEIDLPPLGGTRCKRFSMVVEDGRVKTLQVESDGIGLSCSLAENIKL